MANTDASEEVGRSVPAAPPRENLVRATPGITLERSAGALMPTLTGHFAVWDQWTEIRSAYEGNFMERFAAGSMTKTLSESTPKVLFNHGKDNQVGDKPLGSIVRLEPDGDGAYYEVALFDTSYNRDLVPGLEAGVYGASHRFSVVREDVVQRPKKSDFNPRGIPERTVQEARVMEFGPVTFPAYPGATAGIRSMTDEYLLDSLAFDPERFQALARSRGISLNGVKRFDNEDTGCLAQMLVLASGYIGEQDEDTDAQAMATMQGVAKTLTGLLQYESTEVEPANEPEDEENSAGLDGESRATWSQAEIDNLPDSAFLYIEPGGKMVDGKTTPLSLRHFPYKDAQGNVDLPHLRNALARIPDSNVPESVKAELTAKAQKILAAGSGRSTEPDPSEGTTRAPGLSGNYIPQTVRIEPERSDATTHSLTRDHFRFTPPPKHMRSK